MESDTSKDGANIKECPKDLAANLSEGAIPR
jgi:hypothetical protein